MPLTSIKNRGSTARTATNNRECRSEDADVDARTLQLLSYTEEEIENTTFYKGTGCNACNGTGYRGRQGIFEMMEMDGAIRELAFNRAPLGEIRDAAKASGMRTLLEDGKIKIRNGVTTPEELVRITQAEEVLAE